MPFRTSSPSFIRSPRASQCYPWAVTADGWHRLPLFLSFPFLAAAWGGQWSLILSAAFFLPGLGWLFIAKPSLGAAFVISTSSRKTLLVATIGALVLSLIAFLVVPSWFAEWLTALKSIDHMTPPVLKPGGVIALLGLLRWRRPEARLIAALSCVPQTALEVSHRDSSDHFRGETQPRRLRPLVRPRENENNGGKKCRKHENLTCGGLPEERFG